jgi:hypothetical protein
VKIKKFPLFLNGYAFRRQDKYDPQKERIREQAHERDKKIAWLKKKAKS